MDVYFGHALWIFRRLTLVSLMLYATSASPLAHAS